MNKEELKWWRRLKRVLDDMPETIEILVGARGQISPAARGASLEYFNQNEDVDNVPTYNDFWFGKGVENNGSSL